MLGGNDEPTKYAHVDRALKVELSELLSLDGGIHTAVCFHVGADHKMLQLRQYRSAGGANQGQPDSLMHGRHRQGPRDAVILTAASKFPNLFRTYLRTARTSTLHWRRKGTMCRNSQSQLVHGILREQRTSSRRQWPLPSPSSRIASLRNAAVMDLSRSAQRAMRRGTPHA